MLAFVLGLNLKYYVKCVILKVTLKRFTKDKEAVFMKKVLIVLLVIIILVLGVVIARELIINYDGKVDKSNPMTREEVIALLQKGKEYNNYYYCSNIEDNEMKTEHYIKDNVVATYLDGELKSWVDMSNKEIINIWNMGKEKLVATVGSGININLDSQAGFDYSLVTNEEHYDFEYIGEIEREERTTVVVKMKFKGANGYAKFYIDKETGLIVGRTDITKAIFVSIYMYETDRNVKLDVVRDEDIQKPDSSKYEILENN